MPAVEELEKELAICTAQLNQRAEELAVINSVQEALSKKIDIQGIYDLVGDRIRDLFDAQVVGISTIDNEEKLEKFQYIVEKGERFYPGPRPLGKLRLHLIETKKKIIINNREEGIAWFGTEVIPGTEPIKSAVFVPLMVDDKITSYVTLQNIDKENAFTESDINLLETLANSMSVALENARLFDETNRLLKETEQGKAELAVINSVQEGLVREMDIQGIYNLVGNRIRDLFNAQAVIIATFDHEKKLEHFNYVIEKGETSLIKPRPFDKVRQHLIQTGQNILINENFAKAAEEFGMKVLPGTEAPKSLLFMPMKVGDKVTGYVSLQNIDQEHAFSFSDVRLLSTLSNSMSVALQNAKLFDETTRLLKETEQQKVELAVINSVQEGLAKALDMQAIYDLVGNRIRKLFDAQVVGIATFDHKTETEHIHYLIEKGERYYPAPRPLNIVRKRLIETKEKILINKNFEEVAAAFGLKKIPGTEHPKSALYVPLVIGENVTGYTSLQNLDKEDAFSESDVRLLETLANTMGVALENARLFDETNRLLKETEQQKAELGVINSVQEGLAKELDMQAIYDLVGDRIRELFNAQAVMIVTFDHDTATEHFKYLIEDGQRFYLNPRPYDKLRQHLIMTRQKIVINENYEGAYAKFGLKTLPGTNPTKSGVFVPLITGDKVNSYISLQNMEVEHAFSESDVRLLETLANSMSVALENARLFDETNRLLKETEQRNAELAVINSVQESLVAKMDIKSIYELVGEKIREIFKAQVIDIVTYDPNKNLIEDQYAYEKGDRTLIAAREPKGFRKHVIETGELLLHNDNIEKAMHDFGNEILIGEMPKSQVYVPMIASGEVKGIISLQNLDHENAFTNSDVNLITTLANSMSVALESARLFDETNRLLKETEQRTAELGVINSVQEGLAHELDMQGIYNLVGDRVQKLFNAQVVIIASFDLANEIEHFNYAFENGERYTFDPRPINALRRILIEKKHTIYISTQEQAIKEYGLKPIGGTKMTKSLLFVPLLTGNVIRGYVTLQNIDIEHAFSDSDIRLLETLSNSMSVALENARLFDETNRLLKETEQRTAELGVINSVQEGLAHELDMQGIYNLVGDRIQKLFQTHAVIIASLDLANEMEHFNYVFENGERYTFDPRPVNALRRILIERKQTIHIETEEKARNEYGITAIGETKMPKSMMFVPLLSSNNIKGYVSIQNVDKENAFNESDIRLLETLSNSMSVALENARLFDETNRLLKETEQRTAELAVINSVQEGLAKELDMQGIYNLVGERVQKLFHAQVVIIASFDLANEMEHFNYAFENGERYTFDPRPINALRRILIERKQTIHIETEKKARSEYGITAAIGETKMPKSMMFVPLLSSNNIKGYVSIQNVDKENAFNESDIRLLETLSNSMSVALENARLFDETNRLLKETEQRTAELAVINSVQEGLAKELDMEGIYNLVGDRLCELFPDTQTLVIRTFDHEAGMEYWQYAKEKGIMQNVAPRLLNWNSKQLILTKKTLNIQENYVEISKKHGGTGVTAGHPPKSAVFVPMIVGEEVKGSVSLQNVDTENAFNESDIRLLTTLTNSMSVALENARLFDETTHLLAEAKQRAAELSTVNNISKALASQLDTDELIQFVGEQMRELFNANIVYLALLNQKTKMINFAYQYGEVMPSRMIGEGLTSKVIMTGEPLLINKDVDEITEEMGIQRLGRPAASYLGVPIPVGDEFIGVLSVQTTEQENRFNENDQRLLSTIAASVGVALKNATLFEDVKQAKMEAEAAGNAAEKANEAKSAFLSTVSHELRTPLTSVLGFAKIIKKRLEDKIFPSLNKSDAKTEKVVNQISENLNVVISEGERLTHLINDVLDLAKIEAGKMEWSSGNVSMAEVAERAIAATASLFDQKKLILEKQIEKDLPVISGDKDKLMQVIINLISNAVKFTDAGSITCRVHQKNNELIVDISDTGIGIAPEDHAAVFEQFKQVGGDTLTDKPKGTGLGLPICKEIVEHHKGRIWLESQLGKGSTFSFALPLSQAEKVNPIHFDSLIKQLKEQMGQSAFKMNGTNSTILIVDDDDAIRSLLRQELSDAGYIVEEAGNGKEALEKIRNHQPDLVILDVMMPEMNGFDVAAILKNDPQTMNIPIIVLSIVQDKTRGYRIGVDRYLTKPIDTAKLFTEVGALLEQGKSKKKVMVVDEDSAAVRALTDVLETKGYHVVESNGKELVENAIATQPDIIILNSVYSGKQEVVQTLRFEKGLENVLFLIYQ